MAGGEFVGAETQRHPILYNGLVILFQCAITFMACCFWYMVLAVLDCDWGFDGLVGLLFQTIWAGLFAFLTMIVCGTLGLPLRLHAGIRSWWVGHGLIPLLLAAIGTACILISISPWGSHIAVVEINGMEQRRWAPHTVLLVIGWMTMAFGLLHLYPPSFIQRIVERTIARIKARNF